MLNRMFLLTITAAFCLSTAHAQTQSDCLTSYPMPPNAKPGVSGSFTFTRDGKTMLVPGVDGKIRFIDLTAGEIKRTLSAHSNYVYMANFSPDAKLLASSSRDNTARIWDVASGQELHTFAGFRCAVKVAKFSPDGRMLAASGNDGMLKLWDVKEITTLPVPKTDSSSSFTPTALAISHDGKLIAASYVELDAKHTTYLAINTIVWNAKTGEKLFTLSGHKFDIRS